MIDRDNPFSSAPNLTLVTLNAATELDRHVDGLATSFDATHELATILRKSLRDPESIPGIERLQTSRLITPAMATLYHQAFESMGKGGTSRIETLVEETDEFSELLASADSDLDAQTAERLHDFCVALAENLLGNLNVVAEPDVRFSLA